DLRKAGDEGELSFSGPAELDRAAVKTCVIGGSSGLPEPVHGLIRCPAGSAFTNSGHRRRTPVQTMVTMHIDGAACRLRRPDQLDDAIGGNAVISNGKMDIAETEFPRGFHVGPAAIHADDRLYSQFCDLGKRGVAVRRVAGKDIGRGTE